MPAKRYRVTLTGEEREDLEARVSKGRVNAREMRRAQMLLMADETQAGSGWKDADISKALGVSVRTIERTRQSCVEEGIEAALRHTRPKRTRSKVLDGEAEAYLIQLACSEPPAERQRWTMQLLADRLVELEIVERVSRDTVRTTLKKMPLSLG
jgi:transposase